MSKEFTARIQIETRGSETIEGLDQAGADVALADGDARLHVRSVEEGLAFGDTTVIELALSFSTGIASGVVANALFAMLGTRIRSLVVDDRRVRPTKKDLADAIETIRRVAQPLEATDDESTPG